MSARIPALKQLGSARLLPPRPCMSAFAALCSQKATPEQYPLALRIEKNVPVYDMSRVLASSPDHRAALQDEWYRIFLDGPGVLVTKGLYRDFSLIERATGVFLDLIKRERDAAQSSRLAGDRFAGAGANERLWNSFSKHCVADPAAFVQYYSNPLLGLVETAWLGPAYRITAQVNNVKPGGAAQTSHRDYHLGFMASEQAAQVPQSMHVASQFLTLQGAIAHSNMPLASGPTRLLPFSQAFAAGYAACRLPEFNDWFLEHHVALPLAKGDGLFLSPALFHAAGANISSHDRLANLLQISSAFGKPMEAVDTRALVASCWEDVLRLHRKQGPGDAVDAILAVLGEGYPFPTNLDKNPPRSHDMAPPSEQALLRGLLEARAGMEEVLGALDEFRRNAQA